MIQVKSVSIILDVLSSNAIACWSSVVGILPVHLALFTTKAFLQQLPTLSNLLRWKRSITNECPLCHKPQTNKHVLNNCGSNIALQRYKSRHDDVLEIIANWVRSVMAPGSQFFVDLKRNSTHSSTSLIFNNFRPDMVMISPSGVLWVWELTICHEMNIIQSRDFKRNKYASLSNYRLS